jgi:hypothetical protein
MGGALHQLCLICENINFLLHEPDQCNHLGCQYSAYCQSQPEDTWPHSEGYKHHSSLVHLKVSAEKGCHLCTILYLPIVGNLPNSLSGTTTWTSGVTIFVSRYELQVAYEGRTGIFTFELEESPGIRCRPDMAITPFRQKPSVADSVLFVVRSDLKNSKGVYHTHNQQSVTVHTPPKIGYFKGRRGLRCHHGEVRHSPLH